MSRINRDQLVALAKSEIAEMTAQQLKQRVDSGDKLTIIDVRERDEWVQGFIPNSTFIPRGYLELQIEQNQPDRDAPVVVYCAGGVRSALAARNLKEMGYNNVISLIGGFNGWKNAGFSFKTPTVLTPEQRVRYSRHILLSEVGEPGQIKLLEEQRIVLDDKIKNCGRVDDNFEELARTTFQFLANPHKYWLNGDLMGKRRLLKATFTHPLAYNRNRGYRTAAISLPFSVLREFSEGDSEVVPRDGIEPPTRGFSVRCSTD